MTIKIDPDIVLEKYITNRIRANKNWLGVICGATGSGKSYWSGAVCERFFPTFSVENVVFSVKEFLLKFKELYDAGKRGEIILFDEGEDWNARRSMEEKNVEFGKILSMIRFTNISAIFTLPDVNMIDVNLIRLMHNYIYTLDIDRETCPVWQRSKSGANFFEIIRDKIPSGESSRKLKVKYPRMDVIVRNNKTGKHFERVVKVPELWYPAPSKAFLKEYEIVKNRHFGLSLSHSISRIKAKDAVERNKAAALGVDIVDEVKVPASPVLTAQGLQNSQAIIDSIIAGED